MGQLPQSMLGLVSTRSVTTHRTACMHRRAAPCTKFTNPVAFTTALAGSHYYITTAWKVLHNGKRNQPTHLLVTAANVGTPLHSCMHIKHAREIPPAYVHGRRSCGEDRTRHQLNPMQWTTLLDRCPAAGGAGRRSQHDPTVHQLQLPCLGNKQPDQAFCPSAAMHCSMWSGPAM